MEFHQEELQKVCRVCGKRLQKAKGKRSTFSCSSLKVELLRTFSADVSSDSSTIHPPLLCLPCYLITKRKEKAIKNATTYTSTQTVSNWSAHTRVDCDVSVVSAQFHQLTFVYQNRVEVDLTHKVLRLSFSILSLLHLPLSFLAPHTHIIPQLLPVSAAQFASTCWRDQSS